MARLEELGDASAASNSLGAALAQYGAAAQCGMIRISTSNDIRQGAELGALFTGLYQKLGEAKRRLKQEMANDSNGPVEWSTTPARVIDLALQVRYVEAHNLLGRLGDTRTAERCAACAELLESTADRLTETAGALQRWLYENALEQFTWASSFASEVPVAEYALAEDRVNEKLDSFRPASAKSVVPEAAAVDLDKLIAQLEALARARKSNDWHELLNKPHHDILADAISTHFETLGDESGRRSDWAAAREFYRGAQMALFHTARNLREQDRQRAIEKKLDEVEGALIASKIANPAKVTSIPENLDWESGLDVVESLVLARRFPEANALYRLLKKSPSYRNSWDSPGRFERLGDLLAVTHPEIARWCYEKVYAFLQALPQDNASQAHTNAILESDLLAKLDAVKERIRLAKKATGFRKQ